MGVVILFRCKGQLLLFARVCVLLRKSEVITAHCLIIFGGSTEFVQIRAHFI